MKSYVSVEELNAAALLLAGVQVTELVEVHIAGSAVTVIRADSEGKMSVHRIAIGTPPAPKEDSPTEEVVEEPEEDVGA